MSLMRENIMNQIMEDSYNIFVERFYSSFYKEFEKESPPDKIITQNESTPTVWIFKNRFLLRYYTKDQLTKRASIECQVYYFEKYNEEKVF